MHTVLTRLTSICEDTENAIHSEQIDVKPFNRGLIDDDYLTKLPIENEENLFVYSSTCNFKQLFRTIHLPVSHLSRSLLWFNLLHQNSINKQYRFPQAIERYPEDIRYSVFDRLTNLDLHFSNMFGRRNDITVGLPSCIDSNHLPNYNLNRKGQHARTRILSVFAYYHPDITCAPLLAPITALFLHYMSEIDAYECLLILTSHPYQFLSQTEIQFQSFLASFRSLLRRHCCSTYEGILKTCPTVFDQWIWILFEYLPFRYLVPMMDCLLVEDMKILIRFMMTLLHFYVQSQSKERFTFFRRKHSTLLPTKFSDFIHFIQHLDIPIEKLFKHAFSIHNLQRKEIIRAIQIEEEKIKTERQITRTYHQQNSNPIIMIREFDSNTVSHSDFAYLWSLIPSRLTEFQPERVYCSRIHGHRLRTLYNHVEYNEYCLIVIRNECEEIFGAFCSRPLADRLKTRTWFGTGESFLFTLKPQRQVFKWIGYERIPSGQTKPYEDYFLYANDQRLLIGGSREALNIGLSIGEDLVEGNSKSCDTFANQPLARDEHFQIIEMEVFGFT